MKFSGKTRKKRYIKKRFNAKKKRIDENIEM